MRAIAVSVFLLLSAGYATASDAVSCVQQQLTELGFAPGPADGSLGRRTLAAAELFTTNAGIELPALADATAERWCEAITAFAMTPAAKTISTLDTVGEPPGVLSPEKQQAQWDAYKRAKECLTTPVYAAGAGQEIRMLPPEHFAAVAWTSPFTPTRGSRLCSTLPGAITPPAVISTVTLDERYGERVLAVDQASDWFRRMATFLRYSSDPAAGVLLKQAVLDWAKSDGLGKGIRVSWGHRPVDYQMMTAIVSILAATAEIAPELSADERQVVGPWLNGLVQQVGAGYWKDRQDNKTYMRAYIALLWGLMVGDEQPVQDAIYTYKLAIHDMRPDGSWPIDSQRGGAGLDYNSSATQGVVMIAAALKQARNIDLFEYAVDGRSVHDAVAWVVKTIEDPYTTSPIYALPCPDSGDRWGTIEGPSMSFLNAAGYLRAYAALYPAQPASVVIEGKLARKLGRQSDAIGGAAACQFALEGGTPTFEALQLP